MGKNLFGNGFFDFFNLKPKVLKDTPNSGDIENDGILLYYTNDNGVRIPLSPSFERRYVKDGMDNYCGVAIKGSLQTSPVWRITKITINSDGSNTVLVVNNVKWDDYLVVKYN